MLIVRNIFAIFFASRKALTAAVLTASHFLCAAQFSSLSKPVKIWALLHPFAAMKVKKIQDECTRIYDQYELRQLLDTFSAGGKLDAFRHVYSMAAFAQKVHTRKIRKLGEAHEKGNYRQFRKKMLEEGEKPDSLSSVMDLRNNELGLAIGCNNRDKDLRALGAMVIADIQLGRAVIFRRNRAGHYLDCENRVIDPGKYAQSWHVPKCLVASSETYIR